MTLPPDVDLTKLSDTYVTSALRNEQGHIDWCTAEIEALQAKREQHTAKHDKYQHELMMRKFTIGRHVRYTLNADTGVIVSVGGWLEVLHDGCNFTTWWNPTYTGVIEDQA